MKQRTTKLTACVLAVLLLLNSVSALAAEIPSTASAIADSSQATNQLPGEGDNDETSSESTEITEATEATAVETDDSQSSEASSQHHLPEETEEIIQPELTLPAFPELLASILPLSSPSVLAWPTTLPTVLDFSGTIISTSEYTYGINTLTFHPTAVGQAFEIKNVSSSLNIEADPGTYDLYLTLEDVNASSGEVHLEFNNTETYVFSSQNNNIIHSIKLDNCNFTLSGDRLKIVDGVAAPHGISGDISDVTIEQLTLDFQTEQSAIALKSDASDGSKGNLAIKDNAQINVLYSTAMSTRFGIYSTHGNITVSDAELRVTIGPGFTPNPPVGPPSPTPYNASLVVAGTDSLNALTRGHLQVENKGKIYVDGNDVTFNGVSGKTLTVQDPGSVIEALTFTREAVSARYDIKILNGAVVRGKANEGQYPGAYDPSQNKFQFVGQGISTTAVIIVDGVGSLADGCGGQIGVRAPGGIAVTNGAEVVAESESYGAYSQSFVALYTNISVLPTNLALKGQNILVESGGKIKTINGTVGIFCSHNMAIRDPGTEVIVNMNKSSRTGILAGGAPPSMTNPPIYSSFIIEDGATVIVQGGKSDNGIQNNNSDMIIKNGASVRAVGNDLGVVAVSQSAASGLYNFIEVDDANLVGEANNTYGVYNVNGPITAKNSATIEGRAPYYGVVSMNQGITADNAIIRGIASGIGTSATPPALTGAIVAPNAYTSPPTQTIEAKNGGKIIEQYIHSVVLDTTTPKNFYQYGRNTTSIANYTWSSNVTLNTSPLGLLSAITATTPQTVTGTRTGTAFNGPVTLDPTSEHSIVLSNVTMPSGGSGGSGGSSGTTGSGSGSGSTSNPGSTTNTEIPTGSLSINASCQGKGSITPSGTIYLEPGDKQTFYWTPDNGYVVDYVMIDGDFMALSADFTTLSGPKNQYTFSNIQEDHTIEVAFKRSSDTDTTSDVEDNSTPAGSYSIQATAGKGGKITPAGKVLVHKGDDQRFIFTPERGYTINKVKVDGKTIKNNDAQYTFSNVYANHTIEVSFRTTNGFVPRTGDPINMLLLFSLLGLSGCYLIRHYRENEYLQ